MTYEFPSIYNFPPFFTHQPNEQTWKAQQSNWIQIILEYCKENRIWILNNKGRALSKGSIEDNDSTLGSNDEDVIDRDGIFVNKKIDRTLNIETINEIFKEMVKNSDAFYVTKSDKSALYINWYRPEDWASMILEWVESTGQGGSVLTLYEISNGDMSMNQEFHGIHPLILENALNVLVKRGRAQIIKDNTGKIMGVKIV